jgi:flavin reductase (DIM6/NTAB) family NADH-FMN oxidoreductase RutF
MKQSVDAFDYAGHICKAMKKGILLTTKSGDTLNTMTIGWGKIGIEWNRPVFIAYVRETRHTKTMLEENGEFTVNIPYGQVDPQILAYCGTRSGRDTDKFRDLGLTPVDSDIVSVPGAKNALFGGEGLFNTVVKGPGKVILQTMPINAVADSLRRFFPTS